MLENRTVQLNDVSKMYYLGQMGYRTLREDLLNLFRKKKMEDRQFWALKNVSFDLKKGESVGIIGANGAGKSTILKILAGVTKPTSGIVGKKGKVGALIELSAGFHSELTGRENIYLYGSIIGLKKDHINKAFDSIVDFSGLSQFLDTPIKRYSSGMLARLGFSVTVHLDPDILLIDEVLSVGDFVFQTKCLNKMIEYKERGVSIIFVSHNLDSVKKLCDRAILLNQGRIQFDGDVEMAVNEYYSHYSEKQKGGKNYLPAIDLIEKKMIDSMGRQIAIVNSGEKVRLELMFKTRTNLKDVFYAIFIRDSSGVVIFDTSSLLLDGKKYNYVSDQSVLLKYDLSINLLKGTYMVGVNIFGSSNNDPPGHIFYENNIFVFTVTEDISHQGIVNMHAKCSVELV